MPQLSRSQETHWIRCRASEIEVGGNGFDTCPRREARISSFLLPDTSNGNKQPLCIGKGITMRSLTKVLALSVLVAFLAAGCEPEAVEPAKPAPAAAAPAADKLPVNEVREDGLVPNWHVAVITVNPESDRNKPDEEFVASFKKDYLASIGGEANAVLAEGVTIAYTDEAGTAQKAAVEPGMTNSIGWLSSEWDEALAGRKVAYANCLLKSDKDQTVSCYFGSDDSGKIWANGKLVHEIYDTRSCEAREDEFSIELKKGLNSLMVKTSQRSVSWVFVLEIYPAEEG